MTTLQWKGNSHLIPQSKMCTLRWILREQKTFHLWRNTSTEGMCCHIKGHMPLTWITQLKPIKHIGTLSCQCLQLPYIPWNSESPIIPWFYSFHLQVSTMDASQYWPFAWEYSIWNVTVTALQFLTADLEPHVLSNAIDWVYAVFFYTQQLQDLPEETLFGHFVSIMNDAFSTKLAQEDEGYEDGESFNVATPLNRAPWITMSPQWEIYPSTLQTLDDHQQPQSSMQGPHLVDTEATASPITGWSSPVQMMRALCDLVNVAANTPTPMREVVTPGKQMLHHHYTTTCVTPEYPH